MEQNILNKKVAIIIPSYNGWYLLKELIPTILSNTNYPNFKIIIADDASSDFTVENIKKNYSNIKVVVNKKKSSYSTTVNNGIKSAIKSNYFIIMNNDMLVIRKNWIIKLIKMIEKSPKIGIVRIGIYDSDKLVPPSQEELKNTRLNWAKGIFIIKRELFQDIGLFDEKFTPAYYEDYDILYRAHNKGWKILLDNDFSLLHLNETTSRKIFTNFYLKYYVIPKNKVRCWMLNQNFSSNVALMKDLSQLFLQTFK